jgi:hypothetical protein
VPVAPNSGVWRLRFGFPVRVVDDADGDPARVERDI